MALFARGAKLTDQEKDLLAKLVLELVEKETDSGVKQALFFAFRDGQLHIDTEVLIPFVRSALNPRDTSLSWSAFEYVYREVNSQQAKTFLPDIEALLFNNGPVSGLDQTILSRAVYAYGSWAKDDPEKLKKLESLIHKENDTDTTGNLLGTQKGKSGCHIRQSAHGDSHGFSMM